MAQKKQDFGTKLILWVCVYWWFYPLKWLFYTLPKKLIGSRQAAQPASFTVNLETMTAHRTGCASIRGKEVDYAKLTELTCPWQEIADMGYKPCGRCRPDRQ